MLRHRWQDESFEGRALRAARDRREEQRRQEENERAAAQRRREERFADLMQPIFGDYWPRVQAEAGAPGTELRRGELLFSLADTSEDEALELKVSTQCPTCRRPFKRQPVRDLADVGDILEELQDHPDCASPAIKEIVKKKQAEASRAARNM